jgi:hypothetical protein
LESAKFRIVREIKGGSLTPGGEFVPIARVKYVLPALVAVFCALTACKTTADRRDLYSPDKAQGPYTAKLRGMTLFGNYNHQSTTYSFPVAQSAGLPPEESEPIAPPPPPPPTSAMPDTNAGAPAATPMPQVMPVMPAPAMPPTTAAPANPSSVIPVATPAAAGDQNIPGLSQ